MKQFVFYFVFIKKFTCWLLSIIKQKKERCVYPSIGIDIEATREQISYVFLQKFLSCIPLPPNHIDPTLVLFNQRLAAKKKNETQISVCKNMFIQ